MITATETVGTSGGNIQVVAITDHERFVTEQSGLTIEDMPKQMQRGQRFAHCPISNTPIEDRITRPDGSSFVHRRLPTIKDVNSDRFYYAWFDEEDLRKNPDLDGFKILQKKDPAAHGPDGQRILESCWSGSGDNAFIKQGNLYYSWCTASYGRDFKFGPREDAQSKMAPAMTDGGVQSTVKEGGQLMGSVETVSITNKSITTPGKPGQKEK